MIHGVRHAGGVLVVAAALAYTANCALGTAVALRALDTSRYRWVHHALYITTSALTVGAVTAGAVSRRPAAALLAPALVPLAGIPYAGTRTLRHPLVAVTAAPWYAAALAAVRRD
ncbi:hypothetical protein QDR37_04875 [Amnibacterium sp. CER49]|uniref:hypothetical protein n=1 Tax=Amnibacterium sp. CER49 TaxID=3039161 RepID=UPI0024497643|nr:hypothetical protein [Amnibacterium sp. CER49]MDH2443275.1 hypothetical protein [Amnibacterium sp. CER49]